MNEQKVAFTFLALGQFIFEFMSFHTYTFISSGISFTFFGVGFALFMTGAVVCIILILTGLYSPVSITDFTLALTSALNSLTSSIVLFSY